MRYLRHPLKQRFSMADNDLVKLNGGFGLRNMVPGVGLMLGIAYVAVPYSAWSELLLYHGAVLLLFVAALVGWRLGVGRDRCFPMCVSFALGSFLAGELIWWAYTAKGLDPYPSFADGAFLAGYVPLAAAAAFLSSDGRRERDRSAWLDAGILTAVAGLVVWKVLIAPSVGDPSAPGTYTVVALAYRLADLVVLGFLLVLMFSGAARDRRSALFCAGTIAALIADSVFAYQDMHETVQRAGWVDLTVIVGYALIVAAAITPPGTPSLKPDDAGMGTGRLVCTIVAVLVPQAVILIEFSNLRVGGAADGFETALIAVGIAIVTLLLVSLRMWGLLGRARRVEQRRGSDRLSAVIHHSADAILMLDREHRIGFVTPAFAELADVASASCLGTLLPTWFADDPDAIVRQLSNLAVMPVGSVLPIEGRIRSDGGTIRHVEGTACNLLDDPSIAGLVVTLRDVSDRRELEEQLERRAFHDDLTGLANRALFADRVTHALERSKRLPDVGLAVVFIDLDDFKSVNDGMGHAVGDELLGKVADRLRACLRPADTIARFGGDEFAILLEDMTSPEQAMELAERAAEVLRLPMEVADLYLAVPASVGVAFAVPDSTNESLMRDADIAMYSAKAQGKCRVVAFDDKLRDLAYERLAMKVQLPQALLAGEFQLCYQPIYEVGNAQNLSGFEALLRWNHPTRGQVAPLDFIPLAEETGDIIEIGRWVLEQACQQAVEWNSHVTTRLMMSVNVSAVQLHHSGFIGDVRRALEKSGLPGELLTVELTESVLIEQHRIEGILESLRALGVGIAIDDFGTGYSSLSYLRRFPVTSVKIDRSFIADLTTNRDDGLVRSIIAIAETFALTTVAEGVETDDQLQLLSGIHCQLAQGYHLGRPQFADQFDVRMVDGVVEVDRSGVTSNG